MFVVMEALKKDKFLLQIKWFFRPAPEAKQKLLQKRIRHQAQAQILSDERTLLSQNTKINSADNFFEDFYAIDRSQGCLLNITTWKVCLYLEFLCSLFPRICTEYGKIRSTTKCLIPKSKRRETSKPIISKKKLYDTLFNWIVKVTMGKPHWERNEKCLCWSKFKSFTDNG